MTTFRILIVDDDPGDVGLIRAAITEGRFPCETVVASDGSAALSYLRKEEPFQQAATPDLILLDINMPRLRGPCVLKAMKRDRALACIPVVMLTTSQSPDHVQECYDLGAMGYVTKPMDYGDFVNAVHTIQEYWLGLVSRPVAC